MLSQLQWGSAGDGAQKQLDATLSNAAAPRGFSGKLANLRTPHGPSGRPNCSLLF